MGERIDKFREAEWTEKERVAWAGIGSNSRTGATHTIPGTIEIAIPPARFRPATGDLYVGPDRQIHSFKGGDDIVPAGSKFPITNTFRRV